MAAMAQKAGVLGEALDALSEDRDRFAIAAQ
jgi:hypothetical protein